MSKVTCGVSVSLDGFVAGNNMTLQEPHGDAPAELFHAWQFDEPEKHKAELDALVSAGAFVMGRNMFGPKDLQSDPTWKGWWGDNPPYHAPVFVLSHTKHEPILMEGGTTFYFVTVGIESALSQAKAAAGYAWHPSEASGSADNGPGDTYQIRYPARLTCAYRLSAIPLHNS
jgi:dihydrofolate reductase